MTVIQTPISGRGDDLTILLARVAQRDGVAFSDLYNRTSSKIFGVIIGILGRGQVAEEVMQDAYLKVWRGAAGFDPKRASPIAWIAAIARNAAIDAARRRAPATVAMDDDFPLAADASDPLAGRERSESLRALLKCLSALEHEKRQIILLAYYRGLSRESLSARFGRPEPTIKTWLRRSLVELRLCLSQ